MIKVEKRTVRWAGLARGQQQLSTQRQANRRSRTTAKGAHGTSLQPFPATKCILHIDIVSYWISAAPEVRSNRSVCVPLCCRLIVNINHLRQPKDTERRDFAKA